MSRKILQRTVLVPTLVLLVTSGLSARESLALLGGRPATFPFLAPLDDSQHSGATAFAAPRLRQAGAGPFAGAGGSVAELLVIQSYFLDSACPFPAGCSGPCNAAILLWSEEAPNPSGVDILMDGLLLGSVPGLPSQELPGVNGVNVRALDAGPHAFAVADPESGTFAEASLTFLDAQPFADPRALQCAEGAGGGAACALEVSFENPGPAAEFYLVTLDGELLGELDGSATGVTLEDVPAGERCVGVTAFLAESDVGFYRGCPQESCCTLKCGGATRRYIPALCNGAASLNLSAAVFILRYLFAGGATPHCVRACECNGDGRLNLTDGVCVLLFLFRGGPAPAGWVDSMPVCLAAAPGEDCESSHPACE